MLTRRILLGLLGVTVVFGFALGIATADETKASGTDAECAGSMAKEAAPAAEGEAQPAMAGVKKCKLCHSSAKMAGESYKLWEASPHAKAFESLKSPESLEAAKKMGIEDPTTSDKCLACHTTPGQPAEDGIICEVCHGPAENWLKPHSAKEAPGHEELVAMGMTDLTEKEARVALCMKCHAEHPDNPFNKPFDYDAAWEKIDHSKPEAAEQKTE